MRLEEQVLSIEQAKHLQELGLDMSDAAHFWCSMKLDTQGHEIKKREWYITLDKLQMHCGFMTFDYIPTYTLQEVLNKLPSGMTWDTWQWQITGSGDEMEYNDGDGYSPCREVYGNILEKAYNMLCWVMEHKYLSKSLKK